MTMHYYSYESNENLNTEINARNIRINDEFNKEFTKVTEGIINNSKELLSSFEKYNQNFPTKTIEEKRFIESAIFCFQKISESQPERDINQFLQNVYGATTILKKKWDIMSQLGDNKEKLEQFKLQTDPLISVAGYITKMRLHFSSWSKENPNKDLEKMATLFDGFAFGLNKGLNGQLVNDVLKTFSDYKELSLAVLDSINSDDSFVFSSEDLNKDPEFINKEISNNGLNIKDIPEELKSNKQLALKAIAQNVHAFKHVDADLKSDPDFMLNAKFVARFSDKINKIQCKATELAEKGDHQAAKSAQTLCNNLNHNLHELISGAIKGGVFQEQCSAAINEARPELEKCSGFKAVLDDLLYAVAGVRIFRDYENTSTNNSVNNNNSVNKFKLFKSALQNQKSVLAEANDLDTYVANSRAASMARK